MYYFSQQRDHARFKDSGGQHTVGVMASIKPEPLTQAQQTTELHNIIQQDISSFAGSHSVFLSQISQDYIGHEW